MNSSSCYDTLGVACDATLEEIAAAYQRSLRELRLSLDGPNPSPAERLDALRAAYRRVGDPAARQAYDAALAKPAAAMQEPAQSHDFAFTGSGGEYFRIWIVNLFLSIVTLGIYSAWAKVRRETFFHGKLVLDNSAFGYHGNPVAILKGRVLAFLLLIALSVAQKTSPLAYGLAILALLPVVPWLIVRAFRFRAHNTSYRGLRFSFLGTYRQALTVFVGYGLLSALSLGLLFPLFYRQQKKFVIDNLCYGNSQFQCGATGGEFYRIFLKPVGLALGIVFLAGVLTAMGGVSRMLLPLVFGIVAMVLMLFLMPYIRVCTANLVWNRVTLKHIGFASRLTVLAYMRLIAGNLVLLLLTAGLFWPWAQVRLARYRAECLSLRSTDSLDGFLARETADAPAVGEEISDLMDIDVGL